jgi:hypothetical protein
VRINIHFSQKDGNYGPKFLTLQLSPWVWIRVEHKTIYDALNYCKTDLTETDLHKL